MKAEYLRVDVVKTSGAIESDVHMQVVPKDEVLSRPAKPGGIPLDIALIMYDSTSAANFQRKMPNTLKYLTKHLNSVVLQGLFISKFRCLVSGKVVGMEDAMRSTNDISRGDVK